MYKIITTNSTFTVPKDTVMLSFTGDKTPEALIQARKVLRKMAGGIKNDIALVLDGNIIATVELASIIPFLTVEVGIVS